MDTREEYRQMDWEAKHPPCEHQVDPKSFRILTNDAVKRDARAMVEWNDPCIRGATSAYVNCEYCGACAEINIHRWLQNLNEFADLEWANV